MDHPEDHRAPTSFQKLLFWAILGGLSVFFAEVVSGSYPFPFWTPWGLLVVCPLYLLHVLVLGRLAFWRGRPRLPTLFLAGALVGLYEAYITKQLWNPDWEGGPPVRVGGVAVMATIILVLWWHPLMAFMAPLLVAETALCRSRDIARALPLRLRRALFRRRRPILLIALAVLAGLNISAAYTARPTVGSLLASAVGSAAVILGLVWLWRRSMRGYRPTLADMLPTRREFVLLCIVLGLMYVATGAFLRREALPGLGPQATVWLLYAGVIVLFWRSLTRPRVVPLLECRPLPDRCSWRPWLILIAIMAATACAARLALGQRTWVFLIISLLIAIPVALGLLAYCAWDVLRRRKARV